MYATNIELTDGRKFRLFHKGNEQLIHKLKSAFYDRREKPDVEVVGKSNTIKASEIKELHDVWVIQESDETKDEEKIFFKVMHGFGKSEFFSIPKSEVVKAKYKQLLGGDEIYSYGGYSVQAKTILKLVPDVNRILGFYPDAELKGEDLQLAQKEERQHMFYLKQADDMIREAITQNKTDLLLEAKQPERLAELLNIKLLN